MTTSTILLNGTGTSGGNSGGGGNNSGGTGLNAWRRIAGPGSITALVSDQILADTTTGTVTVTLPASPVFGNQVVVFDGGGNSQANHITIVDPSGNNFDGQPSPLVIDIDYALVTLVFNDSTIGWSASIG